MCAVAASFAQEEKSITVDAGADLVSSYVWRGMYQSGVSFQPTLSVSGYGLTLGAWGSTDITAQFKELDYFLSYEIGGFSAAATAYWWLGEGSPYFHRSGHLIEGSLGYTFGESFPLSLGVNTMLGGEEDKDEDGKQQFSTYITASFPFSIKTVDCEVGVGISPAKGLYADKFDVATISAKASKKIEISDKFALPVFVELILAPAKDNAFLVFGLTF